MTAPTLIHNGLVVTVDAERRIFAHGAVLVRDGRIAEVGQSGALEQAHPDAERIDAGGGIVLPGLVDAHVHLTEAVMRGFALDLGHVPWIGRLRAMEQVLTAEDIGASIDASLLEYLHAGTTTFAESLFPASQADQAAERILASGLRGALSLAYGGPDDAALIAAAHRTWDGREGRLRVFVALRPLAAASAEVARAAGALARRLGTSLSWHFQPNRADPRPITQVAAELDLLWPGALLGHAIALTPDDIARVAASGAAVVTLPFTNTRLAMGSCPVPELQAAGVTVALGSDGDNPHDLFRVMALTGAIHKLRTGDATVLPVESLIEMATMHGARALGLAHEIGSLEAGKRADLIVVATANPWLQPLSNPLGSLVYGATGREVSLAMVDGRVLLREGEPVHMNTARILAENASRAADLLTRAGLAAQAAPRWPIL